MDQLTFIPREVVDDDAVSVTVEAVRLICLHENQFFTVADVLCKLEQLNFDLRPELIHQGIRQAAGFGICQPIPDGGWMSLL